MAAWARRLGRKPYEHDLKSASKIGSSTSFKLACTTRSVAVGMPRRRSLPFALGIIASRTRTGVNRRALRSSRSRLKDLPGSRPDGPRRDAIDPGRACTLVDPEPVPCHDAEGRVSDEVVEII